MILYHWTKKKNLKDILEEGLIRKKTFCLYLTKFPEKWKGLNDNGILLKVKVPKDVKLTCFEEFSDGTEVLCWNDIPPENIEVIEFNNALPTKPKSL